ncbi:MAG: IS21 family transposase, partial [Actinomycetota bacterium]|nr:IS21 family transposase [Actinomycetota bacterium]
GDTSILDAHYGGPRPAPARKVAPRSVPEREFCALGDVAAAFITGAAASGNTRLGGELVELNALAAAHGQTVFLAALERAVAFRRWRAADVRSILAAGAGTAQPRHAGDALILDLPVTPGRLLSEYTPVPLPETPTTATLSRRFEVSS